MSKLRSQKEIRQELEGLVDELKKVDQQRFEYADVRVTAKTGMLAALTAEMAEVSTRRLVWLTWALVVLTVFVLLFTIVLYKDSHDSSLSERENYGGDNYSIQILNGYMAVKLDKYTGQTWKLISNRTNWIPISDFPPTNILQGDIFDRLTATNPFTDLIPPPPFKKPSRDPITKSN